jgi:SAM-dependent methyltransferase
MGQGRAGRDRGRRAPAKRARISVRDVGGARALHVDGTFASFYRPGRARSGPVWDALAAPLVWLPRERRRSVLLLGLGGGSAARLVRALAPRARIVGVEIDPEVVCAARRSFDLDALGLEVVTADAREHLARERRRFDVVVEDVFVGRGRAVRKPDWLPEPGLAQAARRLTRGGLLVSNALDEAPAVSRCMAGLLPAAVEIAVEGYDNRIAVGGPPGLDARGLRRALGASAILAPALGELRFRSLRAPGATRRGSRARPR